jgi:hypothetical protein
VGLARAGGARRPPTPTPPPEAIDKRLAMISLNILKPGTFPLGFAWHMH